MTHTYLIVIIFWLAVRFGLGFFFKKAGHSYWKAFVPVYSTFIWIKIIQKPWWWLLLSFVPVVNLVLGVGMIVELLNCFNRRKAFEHALAAILPFIYLPYLGMQNDVKLVGRVDYSAQNKSQVREWSEALFFAIIAATIIRTFTMEAFAIPTASMEKTLLRGDFIFVSKIHYGSRVPMTPLALPFMHHSIPVLNTNAYLDWIELPYLRFPAFQKIKNNDIVVFNYPMEDYRPLDKREHYVKRCVAIAGDTLQVKNGHVFIDGKLSDLASTGQFSYSFNVNSERDFKKFIKQNDLNEEDCRCGLANEYNKYDCMIFVNSKQLKKLEKETWLSSPVEINLLKNDKIEDLIRNSQVFPVEFGTKSLNVADNKETWTRDNYGPFWIPKQGEKVILTKKNYLSYKRAINVYEHNQLISIEDLVANFYFLSEYQKDINLKPEEYSLDHLNEFYTHQIALPIKNHFVFQKLPETINHWSDGYFIDNAKNSLTSNAKRLAFYKDFQNAFKSFVKNELPKEKEIILEKLKAYNQKWVVNDAPNAELINKLFKGDNYPCLLNDSIVDSYTFKQDYYYMIGDNRHNSGDSRSWGYVPADHIVGKPVIVFASLDPDEDGFLNKIRWDRMCSFVSRDGVSKSYFIHFLIIGFLIWAGNKFWTKRKSSIKKEEE